MAQKKKLQVFVSSTYTDLREERQAAVEAILTAGHIPAGMELFAAGDESQMSVIKRWIDESDVYLLILGGRYGSIEPKSQKSYVHLEYDYAVERGKPLFAVVIEKDFAKKRVKTHPLGVDVIETENPQKFKEFEAQVLTRMVRFWRDQKDIKLAILETMDDLSRREDLTGWILGSEAVNTAAVAEEITRLAKENASLREQVAKLSDVPVTYNGLTFAQMYQVLLRDKGNIGEYPDDNVELFEQVAGLFGDPEPGLIHIFWLTGRLFRKTKVLRLNPEDPKVESMMRLEEYGLVTEIENPQIYEYALTDSGRQFLIRLRLERDIEKTEEVVKDIASVE